MTGQGMNGRVIDRFTRETYKKAPRPVYSLLGVLVAGNEISAINYLIAASLTASRPHYVRGSFFGRSPH